MSEPFDKLAAALADRYRLERELGAGGMATVYLAEDLKHHRKVAVKVLQPLLAVMLGPERFLREITIAASLQHPHILPLYDSGQSEGFLFYVMPFVDGPTLRQKLLGEGALSVVEAVRILRDVADAMAYAHRRGVVHRDLKPENVMLSDRHAMVTDFGVAKAVSEATGRQSVTTAGIALGTPTYMAPEQAAADPNTDQRADLYALGVMGYELLTGRPPFVGQTPQAVLTAHATQPAEPITNHRPSLPPGLAACVMRCLEKNPADRWQNADAVIEQLELVMTPSGGTTPTATVAASGGRRPRRTVGVIGILVVAIAAVSGFLWWRGRIVQSPMMAVASSSRSVAVLPLANLNGTPNDDYFVDGLTEELMGALGKVPGLRVSGRTSVFAFKGKDTDTREVAQRLGVETVLTGSAQRNGDHVRLRVQLVNAHDGLVVWSESYDREFKDVFAIQDEVTDAIVKELRLRLDPAHLAVTRAGRTADPRAHDLYLQGRALSYGASESEFRRALGYFKRALEIDPGYALAEAGTAFTWMRLSDAYVSSPEGSRQAKAAALRALARDSLLGEAHAALGYVSHVYDRDPIVGDREFKRALQLDPNSIDSRFLRAFAFAPQGQFDTAAADAKIVQSLDPLSATASWSFEVIYYLQRRYADALHQHEKTVELDPRYLYLDDFAAASHRERGEYQLALAEYRKAEALADGRPLYGLAITLARMGRVAEARAALVRMTEYGQYHYVDPAFLAMVHAAVGDKDRAIEILTRGVRERYTMALSLPIFPEFDPLRSDPRFESLVREVRAGR